VLCAGTAGACVPENTMLGTCQSGSSAIFLRTKKRRCAPSRAMKGVPGVMQLLSNASSPAGASPARSAAFAACARTCMLGRCMRRITMQEACMHAGRCMSAFHHAGGMHGMLPAPPAAPSLP
jgi:hypothetical protein